MAPALPALLALAVAGCGGDDATPSTGRTATTTAAAAPVRGRCVTAPAATVTQILGKLRTTGAPRLRAARAYRPRQAQGVTFVAGFPGGTSAVAVWATRETPGRPVVFSLNGAARRTSTWSSGGAIGRALRTVPGAERAAACARAAAR